MTPFSTLVHGIEHWANKRPHQPGVHGQHAGKWVQQSWAELWETVRAVAQALIALGHLPGQAVAITGRNRVEWVASQFGVQAAAGLSVPLYPTSTINQVAHIMGEIEAPIAFCDSQAQLERLQEAEQSGRMPKLRTIVVFDDVRSTDERVFSFTQLLALGRTQQADALAGRVAARTPQDTSQLIYTSGTTGEPKGVMMTDAGQFAVLDGLTARFPTFREQPYRVVSYLPLSHQAEQLVTHVGTIRLGGEVFFCSDMGEVREHLLKARPTLFLAVPRVWEKFEAALRSRFAKQGGLAKLLTGRAMAVEQACFEHDRRLGRYRPTLARRLSRALVIDKVRRGLGLEALEVAISGSAPIGVQTLRFFAQLGIPIYEGYGMTENSGVATFNAYGTPKLGTVGPALPGVELKIAADGEVLIRSPSNTVGYYRKPEASAALFTAEGFLRSGDLGTLDEDGSLRITGRKKELLVTAGGKNVAPIEVENLLNRIPGVGHSIVVGDRRPYLCALLTLDPEWLSALAQRVQVPLKPMAEMAADPAVRTYLWECVVRDCNPQLARYQTIKRITVLSRDFSVEGGELTPSLKLRRQVIVPKYAAEIEAMYTEGGQGAAPGEGGADARQASAAWPEVPGPAS